MFTLSSSDLSFSELMTMFAEAADESTLEDREYDFRFEAVCDPLRQKLMLLCLQGETARDVLRLSLASFSMKALNIFDRRLVDRNASLPPNAKRFLKEIIRQQRLQGNERAGG